MKQSALKSAIHKESLADIINDMIETLIKERFELSGFSTLERMARAARVLINRKLYAQITFAATMLSHKTNERNLP